MNESGLTIDTVKASRPPRYVYKRTVDDVLGLTPLPSPVLGSHPTSYLGEGSSAGPSRTSVFFGMRSPKQAARALSPESGAASAVSSPKVRTLGDIEEGLDKLNVEPSAATPTSPRLELNFHAFDHSSPSSPSYFSGHRTRTRTDQSHGITREAVRTPDGVKVPTSQLLSPAQLTIGQSNPKQLSSPASSRNKGELLKSGKTTYAVVKEIGQGAFSRVVLATEESSQQLVALKLAERSCEGDLSDGKTDGDVQETTRSQRQGRFFRGLDREMDILSSVSHPNLIRLLDTFEVEAYRCFVLEYCSGGDLFDLVDSSSQSITQEVVKQLSKEIAGALDYLHQNDIVHRDLKLENILLNFQAAALQERKGKAPLCKITDFGLAKKINSESPLQTTRCGSEEYAAPELLLSKPYDARQTDNWALGCVIYAMMVGELPFQRELPRGLKAGACEATFLLTARPIPMPLSPNSPKSPGLDDPYSRARSSSTASSKGRNGFFNRVVRGEYFWPLIDLDGNNKESRGSNVDLDYPIDARQVVGSLLQTRPSQRATAKDVLESGWLRVV